MKAVVALLLVLLIGAPARAAPLDSVPESGKLSFGVWRHGNHIGSHRFEFRREDSILTVDARVDVAVRIAFITAYRYSAHRVETWREGMLESFTADADDDGARVVVRARATPQGVVVEGSRGTLTMPRNAQPFTLWNRAMIGGVPIFDIDDGASLKLRVEAIGLSPPPRGSVPAHHFRLAGDLDYELWFTGAVLAGLRFKGRDGSTIEYVAE